MDRIDERLRVGKVEAVMVDQVKVDVPDQIVGADQRNLLGLGEIAEIEETEFAEANQDAGGARIFSRIEFPLGLAGAIGIGRRLDAGNRLDVFAVRGEHDDVEAGNVDGVAGMHSAARRCCRWP